MLFGLPRKWNHGRLEVSHWGLAKQFHSSKTRWDFASGLYLVLQMLADYPFC